MIVCHCRIATDRDIQDAVAGGASSIADVARACGAGTDCGSCRPEIERIIAVEELVSRRRPSAADFAVAAPR